MDTNEDKVKICNQCNSENSVSATFCGYCGNIFSADNSLLPKSQIIDANEILNTMSVLKSLANEKLDESGQLFKNFDFIFILHFLSDLIGFLAAFELLGMDWNRTLFLAKTYLYPFKEKITQQLIDKGADVQVLTENSINTIVRNVLERSTQAGRKVIVVEDGGYIVPLLHKDLAGYSDVIEGAVEQTTKGLREDEKVIPLSFPVLSVASAKIKTEGEPPIIADAVWQNVKTLLHRTPYIKSKPDVVIVGYGAIGKQLAIHLRNNGLKVDVFDIVGDQRNAAQEDGFGVSDNLAELVRERNDLIIIGATGKTSIDKNVILALGQNAILVSASSDQREIGIKWLRSLSTNPKGSDLTDPITGNKLGTQYRIAENQRDIVVLADGYPINFWNTESMPIKLSQVAMVPIFLSTVAIALGRATNDTKEPDSTLVDTLVEEEEILNRLLP